MPLTVAAVCCRVPVAAWRHKHPDRPENHRMRQDRSFQESAQLIRPIDIIESQLVQANCSLAKSHETHQLDDDKAVAIWEPKEGALDIQQHSTVSR